MTLAHIAEVLPEVTARLERVQPRSIDDLIEVFEAHEARENPDLVVPTNQLRLTREGWLSTPDGDRAFLLTDWSRRQLASRLGISKWTTWFDGSVGPDVRSNEVNQRLRSRSGRLRLRTTNEVPEGTSASGTLRALVSPLYTPLPDSRMMRLLKAAFEATFEETILATRLDVTERSTTVVLQVGKPFQSGSSEVGAIAGTLTWMNSGVGFKSAALWSSLLRLICLNGLALPTGRPEIFRRAHRAFNELKVRDAILTSLAELPNAFRRAAQVLVEARSVRIVDARPIMRQLLQAARVPLTFLPEVLRAYEEEPDLAPSAFAVSQAVTRAAQRAEPEQRVELERAAGHYLSHLSPKTN